MTVARTTARAAVWAFLATAGGKAVTLLSLVLLARLLAPREFGLLAFAMAYMTYVEAIGDLGSGMALVYWPDRREEASQVTFLINALAGVGWCVVTLALAPAIADFFHATDGAPIVRVLAFSFIIKFLGNTHDALLQKDLRFRARMLPELALAVFKAIVALILAWFGFGAWSLVWGHIAGLTVRTAMVWIAEPWRPSLTWPRDLFRPMLDYGRGIIAVNVLAAITHHADLAVVGRFLGTTALGLYQMAGKVPETSVIIILWVASKVLFPAFARIHATGESLRRAYLMATKYLAAITIPAAAGLILLSKPIVLLFFGAAWLGAAPILSALAAHAALRGITTSDGDALKATGRAPLLARLSLFKAILVVPALIIGAQHSAAAAAWALSGAALLAAAVTIAMTMRILHVPLFDILRAYLPGAAGSVIMAAVLVPWLHWSEPFNATVQVAGGILLGGAVYTLAVALIDRDLFVRARRHFLTRVPTGGEAHS